MKRNCEFLSCKAVFLYIFLFTNIFMISGCSYLSKYTKIFGGGPETVPKVEYDQLLHKYEQLLKDSQRKKVTKNDKNLKKPLPASTSNKLTRLVETVDVFDSSDKKSVADKNLLISDFEGKEFYEYDQNKVRVDVKKLFSAQSLIEEKKFEEALKLLRGIQQSRVRQIRVYSKYYIGYLLFQQNEFDLSLQVFEEIIQKNAFSGVVLKSLQKLVICSEKLSLVEKKDKYNSILNDFFKYNLAI